MDGTPLSNPYSGEVEADGELHLIRISAPGLQTQERVIELDSDKALEVVLVPVVHRAGARRESAAQRASAGKPGPSEESPNAAQQNDEPDFDTRITKDAKARPIYEEDPY